MALPAMDAATGASIIVQVSGEVCSPGTFQVPVGTTVLQAINAAGGFTSFASPYQWLQLERNGTIYRLLFREHREEENVAYSVQQRSWTVWYLLAQWQEGTGAWLPMESNITCDASLKSGDSLLVPRG